MERRTLPGIFAMLAVATALTLTSCASGAQSEPESTRWSSPVSAQKAASSAWNANDGTITVGHGGKRIDIWFDPICLYCAKFQSAQRAVLHDVVSGGHGTVVLHPLNFLDKASSGTQYSTRAVNVLAAAAEQKPSAVLPLMADLDDKQPAEGSSGLDDDTLIGMAKRHGVDARPVLASRPFDGAISQATNRSLRGDNPISGTPAVRIDGKDVPGNDLFTAKFAAALR